MTSVSEFATSPLPSAVLDEVHIGHINSALGTGDRSARDTWRVPWHAELPLRQLMTLNRAWLFVLRAYLIIAAGLILVRIATLATSGD